MLVKDWLSVVIPASNIEVVDGNTTAYGTKESIEENYKDRGQYLSEDEAEELNKFFFDSKNPPRDIRIMFHSEAYERAMIIRERRGYELL